MAEAAAGRRTLALVNLAAIMERADEALLPAVYREVGAALHASPVGLGTLTLYRSHVVAVGAVLWAAATFLVAISGTFAQVRSLTGSLSYSSYCPDDWLFCAKC
jgi:hypothetical protein